MRVCWRDHVSLLSVQRVVGERRCDPVMLWDHSNESGRARRPRPRGMAGSPAMSADAEPCRPPGSRARSRAHGALGRPRARRRSDGSHPRGLRSAGGDTAARRAQPRRRRADPCPDGRRLARAVGRGDAPPCSCPTVPSSRSHPCSRTSPASPTSTPTSSAACTCPGCRHPRAPPPPPARRRPAPWPTSSSELAAATRTALTDADAVTDGPLARLDRLRRDLPRRAGHAARAGHRCGGPVPGPRRDRRAGATRRRAPTARRRRATPCPPPRSACSRSCTTRRATGSR